MTWMEDETLSSHHVGPGVKLKPSRPLPYDVIPPASPRRSAEKAEQSFLESLMTRPQGSPAAALVQKMRKKVREDQGSMDTINRAVYASIAALIKVCLFKAKFGWQYVYVAPCFENSSLPGPF